MSSSPTDLNDLPLSPPLPLPRGQSESSIVAFFASCQLEGAPKQELDAYWQQDWKRFVYTYGLLPKLQGNCLELGANPYFITVLLKYFTSLKLNLANYFGPQFDGSGEQILSVAAPNSGQRQMHIMQFSHFNIEEDSFPFESASFDIALFCEVIEHLQSDPMKVLLEIKRTLRPQGHLILTTPNVARLENVARLLAGANIYDPYSGYGPYGRHNREYNKHDLARLLDFCGFELEVLFSADVHANHTQDFFPMAPLIPLVRSRKQDLGQYLFARARNVKPAAKRRPSWLYRSYPPGEPEP